LTHLAGLAPAETVSVRQVADHYGLSERFLANIVHKLANVKMVESRRGAGGGIRLGRPSQEITVRQVVEALEGPVELFSCESPASPCEQHALCAMHEFWGDVQSSLLRKLETTTVADFVRGDGRGVRTIPAAEVMMPPAAFAAAK
ncbi:MAG: Rrf2 family transcriptional regulator, partial [Candidatus Methylomirabilis sp.]|nr:Rrf2 family transcriptional regulator [Deltaproteobacteria bacterium]